MRVLRIVIGAVIVAFVWAWYRTRSDEDNLVYSGAGSIADANTRRDTAFRAALGNLREDYAERAGWRESFTEPVAEETPTTLTEYVEPYGLCDGTQINDIGYSESGQKFICRYSGFASYPSWQPA